MSKNKLLILTFSVIILASSGCQYLTENGAQIKQNLHQGIDDGAEKLGELKTNIDQTTADIEKKYNQAKEQVETKAKQIDEAGQKIDQAQKSFTEAQEALSKITK